MKIEDIKIEIYQELTFDSLDAMIKEECKKGKSNLSLNHRLFAPFVEVLRKKGFNVSHGTSTSTIYW